MGVTRNVLDVVFSGVQEQTKHQQEQTTGSLQESRQQAVYRSRQQAAYSVQRTGADEASTGADNRQCTGAMLHFVLLRPRLQVDSYLCIK